jgi:hypothetical protein
MTPAHRRRFFLSRRGFGRSFGGIGPFSSVVGACLFLLGETQPHPTNDDVAIRIQCLILCPTLSGMSRSRLTSCARAETISTDDDAATSNRVTRYIWDYGPKLHCRQVQDPGRFLNSGF